MENWTIYSKTILLIYVVITSYSEIAESPLYIFLFLLYFCVNLSIYIFKTSLPKQLSMVLALLVIIVCCYAVNPLFGLLLPVNLYELASRYRIKASFIFIIMLLPLLMIDHSLISLYGLIAVLCFVVYAMGRKYTGRLEFYEETIEKMRGDLQKLTRSLNENNEYLRQSEYTSKLEERSRLSQEIHDQIGHSMTGALIQMEASKRLMETDQKKAIELLLNAIHISKEGIESIRLTLKNVKPPTEQLGINRMKLFIDEFSARHNQKTSFIYGGDVGSITPLQWKIIQENTKEALTNAMKYANATAISVEIRVLNTFIKAAVSDNGKGTQKVVKGLGIIGMEERTASLNGTVIVDGTNGFSVTTLIPHSK